MSDIASQAESDDSLLDQAASEYMKALSQGEEPSISDYVERYPSIATHLRRVLPTMAALEQAVKNRPEEAPEQSEPIPKRLGDFQIHRPIGQGGMGVVYEAEQLSVGRKVALKVLPFTAMLDPTRLERFRNEVRAAATLDHPHCVPIYSVGEDQGIHFYAMKLIAGQTLAKIINDLKAGTPQSDLGVSNPVPLDKGDRNELTQSDSLSLSRSSGSQKFFRQVAKLGIQAAEGLDHAHEKGIVHRDIKPSNLIVDDSGCLWITDFGLARVELDSSLTMTGDFLGTLRYTSPEQAMGDRGKVDHRSDVYSLGATLFELLALRPVFDSDDRIEVFRSLSESEPPSLSKLVRTIPIELETIIGKAIEKNPSDRYATAQELALDLGRYLRHEPILARRSTTIEKTIKWTRRHPAASLMISVLAASMLLVVWLSLRHAAEVGHLNKNLANLNTDLEQSLTETQEAHQEVLQNQALMEHYVYVSDIRLAYRSWEDNDLRACENLLLKHLPENQEDPPGVEWRMLWRLSHPPTTIIDQGDGALYALAFSPSKNIYVAGGEASVLRIYDATTDQLIRKFATDQKELNSIAFSPDGSQLATAGDDGTVKFWSAKDYQFEKVLQANSAKVYGVQYFPDGNSLLTWGSESKLAQWDCVTLEKFASYAVDGSQIQSANISSDGSKVFATTNGRNVVVLSTQDQSQQSVIEVFKTRPNCVAYSEKRAAIYAGLSNWTLAGWKLGESKRCLTLPTAASVGFLTLDEQEQSIAYGDEDGIVRICDLDNLSDQTVFPAHSENVYSILIDSQNRRLISCGGDGLIRSSSLDSQHYRSIQDIASNNFMITSKQDLVAFSPGSPDVRSHYHLQIKSQDMIESKLEYRQPKDTRSITNAGQLTRLMATYTRDGFSPKEAIILNSHTGKTTRRWPIAEEQESVAISPSGRYVAATLSGGRLQLYDTEAGVQLHEFILPSTTIRPNSSLFSPDETKLATTTSKEVVVFDLDRKKILYKWRGSANALAFCANGETLAVSGPRREILLWDVTTGKEIAKLPGHLSNIRNLQFLSNDRLLSNDEEGFAIWDLSSQQQFFYHEVAEQPHDLFAGQTKYKESYAEWDDTKQIDCAKAAAMPDEDWFVMTASPGNPQFLKLDVSDVWPKR